MSFHNLNHPSRHKRIVLPSHSERNGDSSELTPEEERTRGSGRGPWASKFLKPSRKMRGIQPEISSTVPHALLATEARGAYLSHQPLQLDGRSNRAPQSRHSAILPAYFALWSGRGEAEGISHNCSNSRQQRLGGRVPFSTQRRHRECSSPKLRRAKCPGFLLRNLDAEFTWPQDLTHRPQKEQSGGEEGGDGDG